MSLLTKEERDGLIDTMVNGLPLPDDMPIDELTIQIWQNIAELPHPMHSAFNIIGKSDVSVYADGHGIKRDLAGGGLLLLERLKDESENKGYKDSL